MESKDLYMKPKKRRRSLHLLHKIKGCSVACMMAEMDRNGSLYEYEKCMDHLFFFYPHVDSFDVANQDTHARFFLGLRSAEWQRRDDAEHV